MVGSIWLSGITVALIGSTQVKSLWSARLGFLSGAGWLPSGMSAEGAGSPGAVTPHRDPDLRGTYVKACEIAAWTGERRGGSQNLVWQNGPRSFSTRALLTPFVTRLPGQLEGGGFPSFWPA